ncbi:MAG: TatD family hydrolase [Alphaproteobacteria bacterium]|nr:TatD family hydrolase [Alphaproteobacteria bacterium]
MLIDTHCHLDFPDFAVEQEQIVARARAMGVARFVTISTHVEKFDAIRTIAERYEDVFCTVGTHPSHANEEREASIARLLDLAGHPKCVGIGEAGLDYHYDKVPHELAHRVFRTHIAAARESGLPLVIHSRDADDDCAAILQDEMGKGTFKALLHCFTGRRVLAETAVDLGLYISFSGALTFKNSQELRDIARDIPLDRLLVETDAPFLAPVPHRGKRNEPAFVADTARMLASVKEVSFDEIAHATTANALALFSKMASPASWSRVA